MISDYGEMARSKTLKFTLAVVKQVADGSYFELQPLLDSRHNHRPIRQQYDKKHLSHRPFDRVRKANEPEWNRVCPKFLLSSAPTWT
jgi:hypothetical protein